MSEKTLFEIYDDILNSKEVKEEDLRLAVLTYRNLLWFANHDVEELYKSTDKNVFAKNRFENNVMRYKKALNETPRHWLGEDNIPGTKSFEEQQAVCENLWNGFLKWRENKNKEE